MFDSDSVGGADANMKGFGKRMPVNSVDRSATGISSLVREARIVVDGPWAARATGHKAHALGCRHTTTA